MQLQIANTLTQIDGIPTTFTQVAGTAGLGSIQVKNVAGFTNGWAIQKGQTGEETAEILNLNPSSGVTNQYLTFGTSAANTAGTVLFNFNNDTPIYQIHYDQIIIYRSTTGTAGNFSSIGVTNITPDNQYTNYNDSAGASTYAYYVQYYNSVSGDLSGTSSVFVPGGPTYYSLQKMRQRVKDKLYSAGYIREDAIYTDWINEWLEQMQNEALKVNQAYMLGSQTIAYGTNGYGTVTNADFKQPFKLEITTDGLHYTPSHEIPLQQFSEQDWFPGWDYQHSWRGETVFEILPHGSGGTVNLTYGQRFTPLVNDSDELPQTLKAYTTGCIEYCLAVAYGLDNKDTETQLHQQNFMQSKQDFITQITPRDQTGPHSIQIVDSISGIQDDVNLSEEYFSW